MRWMKPDFEEINLSGEVTAYVNTDDESSGFDQGPTRSEVTTESAQETSA